MTGIRDLLRVVRRDASPLPPVFVPTDLRAFTPRPPALRNMAHFIGVAARERCKVVFSFRLAHMGRERIHVATYSRSRNSDEGVPRPAVVEACDYARLLCEAQALCGGRRWDAEFDADWLPEGVDAVSIRWIAPVRDDDRDTFRIEIRRSDLLDFQDHRLR